MAEWLHRAIESPRVRNATLASIGFLGVATCGGAVLANFTVAGMNPIAAHDTTRFQVAAERPGWSVALDDWAPEPPAEYSETSY